MKLSGKVAVITGAGGGIGRAIAFGFAKQGAAVVIAEVDPVTGSAAACEIERAGGRAMFVPTDVACLSEVTRMVETVVTEFGKIDVLVNNAGIHISQSFLDVTEETFDRTMNTNLRGAFFCAQAVARHMIAARSGKIIHMSSVSAEIADEGSSHYCVSKGGLQMLTRAMALELARYNVHVNAIAPGTIKTALGDWYEKPEATVYLKQRVPWGRFGSPEDVVGAAVFLASDDSNYVTGASLVVDGGLLAG